MNDEDAIQNIYKKIEREKALMNAANAMRQQTNNEAVRSKLDTQMRDGRRNLQFFEEKLRELQMRRMGQDMGNMHLSSPSGSTVGGGPSPGSARPRSRDEWSGSTESGAPLPPPKDGGSWDQASYGSMQYGQMGAHGDMMPPHHPYAQPAPSQGMGKPRPNFTKLGR